MRDNDGRKLDHKTLEALRIRAVDRVGEGAHPEDVAAALGLHRKTVYDWLAKYREGGKDALKARPVPGRPPKLGGPQLVPALCADRGAGSAAAAVRVRAVDPEMIREVIRREFGVALTVVSVGPPCASSACRRSGRCTARISRTRRPWSGGRKRPTRRSGRKPRRRARSIYFADEAGIRSDYHAGTTWSPSARPRR